MKAVGAWLAGLDWQWLRWQVGLPIFLAPIVSAIVVLGWSTGPNSFDPDIGVIIDLTPWAMATYVMTR